MNPLVGALILVLIGLLGARFSFNASRVPLGPRLFFSSGTHFLFLGFLLGSTGLGLLSRVTIDQLYPIFALGLGWIGLLFGLQLDRRHLIRFPPGYLLMAVAQAAIAFLIFFVLGALILGAVQPLDLEVRGILLATAATASISTPAAMALISNTFLVRGRISRLLFFIASLDAIVGIVALQFSYAYFHPAELISEIRLLSAAVWIAIALALGIIFGIFFLWLTRPKPSAEELTLYLLGLVVFGAGTALYLGLSPLFLSTVTGAVIANLSPLRRRVYALLQTWEQPLYIILLILAGALLSFPGWVIVPLALGYVLVRLVAKVVGNFFTVRAVRPAADPPDRLGLGLIPQGGISLAMAISITLTYGALRVGGVPVTEVLYSTTVLGVVLSEMVGPFMTRNLLRRAGEISPRVETELVRDTRNGPVSREP